MPERLIETPSSPRQTVHPVSRFTAEFDGPLAGPTEKTEAFSPPVWARAARIGVLLLTDLAVIGAVALLSVYGWAVQVRGQPASVYLQLLPLFALFPVSFAQGGLYPGFGVGAVEILRRLWIRTFFVFLMLTATSYAFRVPHHYSRLVFLATLAGTLVLLPLARLLVLSLMQRVRWWGEPALIIGTGALAYRSIEALRSARSLGYRPQWVLSPGPGGPDRLLDLPVFDQFAYAQSLGARGVRVALVALEGDEPADRLVHELQKSFRQVLVLRSTADVPVEGVGVKNLGGMLGVEYSNQLLRRRNRIIKRAVDVGFGGLALLAALPVVVVSAMLVKLVDRGPALFSQTREGVGGRRIRVRKIRTMYVDAAERLSQHLSLDPAAKDEWERSFKLRNDPRIIPVVGSLLRRFSIDELPQLWNVVKGDMSLVGPRPFPEYHLRRLDPTIRQLRSRVRPGLTGLWQVMVRSQGSIDVQEFYDAYYIRNWSLWMDLYVLARTVGAVIVGKGAY